MGDAETLAHLSKTRGIDKATAERFKLGITGAPGARFRTLPVTDGNGMVIACKAHRADEQEQKSWWQPKGTQRSHLWPVDLKPDGAVWVCPGELKALAVIGCGRAAVGITSGEGNEKAPAGLPPEAFELLRGRAVAIPPDDDPTGAAWGEHVRQQLADAGIDARIIDLGLDKAAGLEDVGDWITRKLVDDCTLPETVAADLNAAYERSDPWHGTSVGDLWADPSTWKPATYVSTGLRDLDSALGGGFRAGGVHILGGKTGHAKSQLAATVAVNAARHRVPVGFFSLELRAADLAQLVAAQLGNIPRGALAHGAVGGEYGERLRCVLAEFGGLPLTILDDDRWPGGLTRDGLVVLVVEGVKRFGWRLVVIDYLGLLAPAETDADQYHTELHNSTALRRIARKHDLGVLVVVALRKGATPRATDTITIDDVLGAGRLVYDSQTVAYVWRDTGDDDSGLVRVRIFKSRFSRTHNASLQFRWHPKTGAIVDLPL